MEIHPKVFNGKRLFRDLTLQILKLTNKMFPILCKIMFSVVFFLVLFKAEKTLKINITPYGENL